MVSGCTRKFQSTHPVWGATTVPAAADPVKEISIHAPRVGCDPRTRGPRHTVNNFNPRTPCGVRPQKCTISSVPLEFQSTHPVWGATITCEYYHVRFQNFNPRTPCGVRPRAASVEGQEGQISIHAPRVGCDTTEDGTERHFADFNPRTPCGVRRGVDSRRLCLRRFQSTHPVWGATHSNQCYSESAIFQSTHPVWGATKPQLDLLEEV